MSNLARVRQFADWVYNPTDEEKVNVNKFHDVVKSVFSGYIRTSPLDAPAPDPNDINTKIANLLKARLILLGGDVIYVREGKTLHTLGDSTDLLSYYMHSDAKEAMKAANILETNFQGYFPIKDNFVLRNVIELHFPNEQTQFVDISTLEPMVPPDERRFAEFGEHRIYEHNFEPLHQFFSIVNQALGEEYFLEKTMLYHFNQPFREKSHVLVGGGGNGKSMFMGLIQRLYGDFALTDAPQPNFTGHAAAVCAYQFIGKRIVTFNDVGDPSAKMLEWLKRMITGKLEVKTPTGSWLTVPCNTNFIMETNHVPQILGLEAHRRRFVIRQFDSTFRLKDYIDSDTLDKLGDRGDITAGDIVNYLLTIKNKVDDWATFEEKSNIFGPDGGEIADES